MDTIYGLFAAAVEAHRKAPAIIEDGRTFTFGALQALAEAYASQLPKHFRTAGLVMPHGAEQIAAILAVLRCGARYVPAEPGFPMERIRMMMDEAGADFILTERDCAPRLEGRPLRFVENLAREGVPDMPPADDGEAPAYVLYTSGTTGRPKGVCVRNRNVCHYVRAFSAEFHPGPGDVMLQNSVCSFDIFVEEVFASLLAGAALAIPAPADKADARTLMDFAARHRVTMLSGFPYLLADLNRLGRLPESLRLLISGGDVLRAVYVDRLLPQAEVYNTYGPSETTVCASYYRCRDGAALADGTYPIGRPVRGADIAILDEAGQPVPDGAPGELCITGGGVSLGYIGDHAEENRAFVRLPDGRVMYRSGDLGYRLPDGNIAFLHRKDRQIMIYGKRVETAEVEASLYRCPGVKQALVRAREDERHLAYMTAYVVPDGPLTLSELRRSLARYLPDFMIPEFFVELPAIPLNVNGKPDESRLPVVLKEGAA